MTNISSQNITYEHTPSVKPHMIIVMDRKFKIKTSCCSRITTGFCDSCENSCCQALGLIVIGIPYILLLAAFFIEVIIYEYFSGNKVFGDKERKTNRTEELMRVAFFICSMVWHVALLEIIT